MVVQCYMIHTHLFVYLFTVPQSLVSRIRALQTPLMVAVASRTAAACVAMLASMAALLLGLSLVPHQEFRFVFV